MAIDHGHWDKATENLRTVATNTYYLVQDSHHVPRWEYPMLQMTRDSLQKWHFQWAGRILAGLGMLTDDDRNALRAMGIEIKPKAEEVEQNG
jgi:hypothetical protein